MRRRKKSKPKYQRIFNLKNIGLVFDFSGKKSFLNQRDSTPKKGCCSADSESLTVASAVSVAGSNVLAAAAAVAAAVLMRFGFGFTGQDYKSSPAELKR